MAKRGKEALRTATARSGLSPYATAAAVMALVVVLVQAVKLGGPVGGFHGYNEGYYFAKAIADTQRGLLAPMLEPADIYNPFVVPLLLSWALRLFGPSVAVARLLMALASAAIVLLTFEVGRRLYNEKIALLAAVIIGVTPGLLIVGRNIQLEPVMLALDLGALAAYLAAVPTEDRRWAALSGLLFGIGLLAKLPVILSVVGLAVWQTWRSRGLGWVKLPSTWLTALVAGLVSVPWYAYNMARTSGFAAAQSGNIGRVGGWQGWTYFRDFVASEWVWILSVPIALLTLAGLGVTLWKRTDADKFVASMLVVHMLVFVYYNYHPYYAFPLLPFAALAGARALWLAWARTPARIAVTVGLIVVLCLPFSILVLSAKKWSVLRVDEAPRVLRADGFDPQSTTVGVWSVIEGQMGPAVLHYFQDSGFEKPGVFQQNPSELGARPGDRIAVLSGGLAQPVPGIRELAPLRLELNAPVVFGWAIRMTPGRVNFFAPGAITVARVGPPWRFGLDVRWRSDRAKVLYEITGGG